MITLIENLGDNVIGLSASGTVTGHDYENVVIPAVEQALAKHRKVRLLYHCGPEFKGFDAAAMWDDAKVGLHHFSAWERIAVVSDIVWVRAATKIFGFALPGPVRVFHNDELGAATEWVAS
jgi:hypothetical protein